MAWAHGSNLGDKLHALRSQTNPHARGREFEAFLSELFGSAHFRVERDFVTGQRQIDLFAELGSLKLLIEAKWTNKAATQNAVDGLVKRLERGAPETVGVLVSMNGFSKPVIERVERDERRVILLVDGNDIQAAADGLSIRTIINWKHDEMVRQRKVVFGIPSGSPLWIRNLPEATVRLVDIDGQHLPCWESRGDFANVITTLHSPDPAWARLGGVTLSFQPDVRHADELNDLLRRLAQLGFLSQDGMWRIEQQGTTWAGVGAAELVRQTTNWSARYDGRRMHHSEKVVYIDDFRDGILLLTADIDGHDRRAVRYCELTFTLTGIPVDTSHFDNLRAAVGVRNYATFQFLGHDPTKRRSLRRRKRGPLAIRPKGYLLRDDPVRSANPWIVGVVAADPVAGSVNRSRQLGLSWNSLGDLIVPMTQHYQWGDDVQHHVDFAMTTQVSDVKTLYLRGDWAWTNPDPDGAWR